MPQPEAAPSSRALFFEGPQARRLVLLLSVLLLLTCWTLNARVTHYDFLALGDDDINVTLNPHLGALTRDRMIWMVSDWSYVRRFMPLGWFTFCATYGAGGLDPSPYHCVALGFYLINTVLIYALVLHGLRICGPRAARGLDSWQAFAAFLAAGFWALNPLRVESTAWISGLLYGQSGMFFMLAGIAYLRSHLLPGHRIRWLCLSFVALTASLATYPLALGFPFLILLFDLYLWRTKGPAPGLSFRRILIEKIVFFMPVVAVALFTLYARLRYTAAWGEAPTLAQFPLLDRLMQCAYIVSYYLWRPFLPFGLSPIYSALHGFDPWSSPFVLSALLVIGVSAVAAGYLRSRPWVCLVWLGYLSLVFPFVGFTEHPHYACDRYAYLPTVLLTAALAVGICSIETVRWRSLVSATILCVLAVFGCVTDRLLGIWTNSWTMYQHMIDSLPEGNQHDDIVSRFALLEYLYGHQDEAVALINRAFRDFPRSEAILKVRSEIEGSGEHLAPPENQPISYMHYRMAWYFRQMHQPDEAEEQLRATLRLDPRVYPAAFDLAILEATEGRPRDALHHLLGAETWADGRLNQKNWMSALTLIQASARLNGEIDLDKAIDRRLTRQTPEALPR